MMEHRNHLVLLGAALLTSSCSGLQTQTVTVETGTQFAVTGDSKNLYMDMQGILWKLPARGGEAVALSTAADDLRRPQLSPDGRRLVMQSFAAGNWDIVVTDTEGNNRRQLTSSPYDDREPAWSADGTTVLFTSDRTGNDDIWSIEPDTGRLTQLTDDPANDFAPAAVGNALLFVSDRDGTPALFIREGEQVRQLAKAPAGRLHPPRASPDGRHIAWVQASERNGFPGVAVNELVSLDTDTGAVRVRSAPGSDVFAEPPAWLANGSLLYTADGTIQRLDPTTGAGSKLPFAAELKFVSDTYRRLTPLAFSQAEQPMRGVVDPALLSDGAIVFTALGDLWQLGRDSDLAQLTDDAWVERDLSVSPDGTQLAYISDRGGSMQIWLREVSTGRDIQLTTKSTGPRYPTFAPDGRQLAYQEVGPLGTQDFTARVLDLQTGAARKLRSSPKLWPGRMAWSADGKHLIVAELYRTGRASDGRNRLVRIDTDSDTADEIELPDELTPDAGPVMNPAGTSLALIFDGTLWLLPVNPDGTSAAAPERVLDALVESPAWSNDGSELLVLGPEGLTRVALATGAVVPQNLDRRWQPAAGAGQQLIHAGRLWDGDANTYQSDVDIVIDGARIVAIRPHAPHPANLPVIDATGQTVLPGLIDHHVHFEPHRGEWVGRALLAYGVTTVVEPGGLPYESRENFESWQSGRRIGPRLVYAGPQLDGARRTFHFASHINSEERLMRELERGDRLGYGLLKTYRRLAPKLQQRTVELGHERGLPVTAHAAMRNLGFGGDRTEHLRGSSRAENSPKQSDLLISYADIMALYSLPGAAVTPTLINQGGYFDIALRRGDGFRNVPQYTALYPEAYRANLDGFTKLVSRKIDLVRTGLGNAGDTINALNDNGARVIAGTDSPIFPYGLSLVIELQNYVDAGLTPAAALRTATSNAADAMGAGTQAGRIQPGLLADIVIVAGDPLGDIGDLLNVQGIMLNGRYHMLETLLEKFTDMP